MRRRKELDQMFHPDIPPRVKITGARGVDPVVSLSVVLGGRKTSLVVRVAQKLCVLFVFGL